MLFLYLPPATCVGSSLFVGLDCVHVCMFVFVFLSARMGVELVSGMLCVCLCLFVLFPSGGAVWICACLDVYASVCFFFWIRSSQRMTMIIPPLAGTDDGLLMRWHASRGSLTDASPSS